MPKGKARFLSRIILPVVLLAGGIAVTILTSIKAHEYYYSAVPFGQFVTEPRITFTAERTGRYEISYKDELGELIFDVVEMKTGAAVPVSEFGLLTEIVHTAGYKGHAFYIERPGSYQLSVWPWPQEAKLELGFSNHQAIAYWSLGGLALGSLLTGFSILLLIAMLHRSLVSRPFLSEPPE